jgi:hypothetical protein
MEPIRSCAVLAICAYMAIRPDVGFAAGPSAASVRPTPIAAGRSLDDPTSVPNAQSENDDAGDSDADEENVTVSASILDIGSSEPFLCEFSLEKDRSYTRWVNSGSDYPRLAPPFTKRELLSRPFSRSQRGRSASWGACSEAAESSRPDEITVALIVHSATSKTVPDSDANRCRWTSAGKLMSASRRFRLKIGQWIGVEFKTLDGDRKRISLHWTRKPQTDTTGQYCRKFATHMNKNSFNANGFKQLQLKAGMVTEETRGPSSEPAWGLPDEIE